MVKTRRNGLRCSKKNDLRPVDLKKEARDFDIINEKRAENIKSILVNDTRIEGFFYKNPWRYDFSRKYAFGSVLEEFKKVNVNKRKDMHILDIGCGNGWFSLNANLNNRHYWDCIDISRKAVAVANVYKKKFGATKNQYFVESIECFKSDKRYDIITCVNSLHHLSDLNIFASRVKEHLKPKGRLFVSDVSSDLFSEINALFVLLIRTILESADKVRYYEKFQETDVDARLKNIIFEWQNETDHCKQSIHDHFHSTPQIISFLKNKFETIYFEKHGGILMRLLGGLRGDPKSIRRLSDALVAFESRLLKKNIIAPYTYSFVGKSKKYGRTGE